MSASVLQGIAADLVGSNEKLLLPLKHLISRPGFKALIPLAGTGKGIPERDALLQDIRETFSPQIVEALGEVLSGFLDLPSTPHQLLDVSIRNPIASIKGAKASLNIVDTQKSESISQNHQYNGHPRAFPRRIITTGALIGLSGLGWFTYRLLQPSNGPAIPAQVLAPIPNKVKSRQDLTSKNYSPFSSKEEICNGSGMGKDVQAKFKGYWIAACIRGMNPTHMVIINQASDEGYSAKTLPLQAITQKTCGECPSTVGSKSGVYVYYIAKDGGISYELDILKDSTASLRISSANTSIYKDWTNDVSYGDLISPQKQN